MANRFWVGGTASWDGTIGLKWALTSGGVGGQAAPTASDDVFLDAASGAVTVTTGANPSIKSLSFSGFTGTFAGVNSINSAGSVTFVAGMTTTYSGTLTLSATATLTSAGKTLGGLTVNGAGITATLADNLVLASSLVVTQGTLDAAANNVNVSTTSLSSSNSNTRAILFGSGTWTCTGATPVNMATSSGMTITPGTATIKVTEATSSSSKAFSGGGLTFPNLWFSGEGTLNITGANTFADLKVDGGNVTVTFPASTTTTVTSLTINGSVGNYTLLQSSILATQATISDASGTDTMTFVALRDMAFSGGATFAATSSYDLGDNTGITITAPSSGSTNQITRQGLSL